MPSSKSVIDTLYPVIVRIPQESLPPAPRDRNAALSRFARIALQRSADRSGAQSAVFRKSDRNAPLPCHGWYWSITHKPGSAGGVVARSPVGIDLEEIRTCSDALIRKAANPMEWELLPETDRNLRFLRIWTAKEAVLKAEGRGIGGLKNCRVISADGDFLRVQGNSGEWEVEHLLFGRHVAAVTRSARHIRWSIGPPD